ncbi:uncharacterized protein V6R79_014629 [Siganus canaliculatus]
MFSPRIRDGKVINIQKMSTLSAASVEAAAVTEVTEEKKPLRPCCACPETKKVRDAWLFALAVVCCCASGTQAWTFPSYSLFIPHLEGRSRF